MSADSQPKFEGGPEDLRNFAFEFNILNDSVDRRQEFISPGPAKPLTVQSGFKDSAHFVPQGASEYELEAKDSSQNKLVIDNWNSPLLLKQRSDKWPIYSGESPKALITLHETWASLDRSTIIDLSRLLRRWVVMVGSYVGEAGSVPQQKPETRLVVTDLGTVPGPVIGRGHLEDSPEFPMLLGPEIDRGGLDESKVLVLKDHVDTAAREAVMDGWAGGDAIAVDTDVVANAKRLIDSLPKLDVLPEVAATEHGEIGFDWAPTDTCTLRLTVGARDQITLSGLFDDTLVSGKEQWESGLPQLVQCCLERVRSYDREAQSGPASTHRDVSERRLRNRVLKAIGEAEEIWQDPASIARRSALPEELVLKVLYEDTSDVIYEQRASGKVVFSTRAHYVENASAAQKLLGAFRNRLR